MVRMASWRSQFAVVGVVNVAEWRRAVTPVALPTSDFYPLASPTSSVMAFFPPLLPRLIPTDFPTTTEDRPPLSLAGFRECQHEAKEQAENSYRCVTGDRFGSTP
jgi:hypothetical protein